MDSKSLSLDLLPLKKLILTIISSSAVTFFIMNQHSTALMIILNKRLLRGKVADYHALNNLNPSYVPETHAKIPKTFTRMKF